MLSSTRYKYLNSNGEETEVYGPDNKQPVAYSDVTDAPTELPPTQEWRDKITAAYSALNPPPVPEKTKLYHHHIHIRGKCTTQSSNLSNIFSFDNDRYYIAFDVVTDSAEEIKTAAAIRDVLAKYKYLCASGAVATEWEDNTTKEKAWFDPILEISYSSEHFIEISYAMTHMTTSGTLMATPLIVDATTMLEAASGDTVIEITWL